jgi:hypothetical protein
MYQLINWYDFIRNQTIDNYFIIFIIVIFCLVFIHEFHKELDLLINDNLIIFIVKSVILKSLVGILMIIQLFHIKMRSFLILLFEFFKKLIECFIMQYSRMLMIFRNSSKNRGNRLQSNRDENNLNTS